MGVPAEDTSIKIRVDHRNCPVWVQENSLHEVPRVIVTIIVYRQRRTAGQVAPANKIEKDLVGIQSAQTDLIVEIGVVRKIEHNGIATAIANDRDSVSVGGIEVRHVENPIGDPAAGE